MGKATKKHPKIPGFVPTFGRCPTCEASFSSKYALKAHRLNADCKPQAAEKPAGIAARRVG